MSAADYQVVIVGAGPTGLMLSNLLGRYGVRTLIIERLHELIDYPRAIGIDDEALRSMQAVDLVDKVLPHTVPHHMVRAVNSQGRVIAEMAPQTDEFGWSRRNGFIQPLVDRVLLAGLDRFPHVEVRLGHELLKIEQTSEQVACTIQDVGSGQVTRVTAEYMVGAEGGRSFTREWLGANFEGVTLPDRCLVVDVADDPLGTPNAIFGADPVRSWATFGLPHGIRRWEFMLGDDEDNELAESDAFVRGLLTDHVRSPERLNIIRRRVYTHNARIASAFRRGRVFIAGDAAHVMPVNAGQGWNSCIRDAVNLGWKLAAVLNGTSSAALLDTYEVERRDHVRGMVELSVGMGKAFASRGRLREVARTVVGTAVEYLPPVKRYVASMRFKPMPSYTRGAVVTTEIHRSKSILPAHGVNRSAGRLFIQPKVSAPDGAVKLLDDVIGLRWAVLAWNNDPRRLLSEKSVEALERLGAAFVQAVPEVQREWTAANASDGVTVIGDALGRVKKWFDDKPYSVLFLRPDRVIAAECLAVEADRTTEKLLDAISYLA
ncbi:bifunctional 3-(3-hydroxy-phenyl)propionate/3-hydroxycinnamic acid hydroxylase [Microbispora catharanthi]|uniref:Bifunctional 3-(3-hydroxy-phenyl)propionate/3-hydroxycinnamic acid hydroxylase n=1 Tax=Microbispora catharanthi TaxID=1712871 RepID=A0A5N6BTN1_9ACTN|nr:bifunctional 3-(3-hydroxy-phenyl)propionate/3-hydroxycinnamic acid hydroxylase [Microbispora catharanthi]KAB8183673.1 bifunctional 3-(3-hydroxy-phenyl)propionate/3-hydroxycinnamic acid hydroxylase [Microbispora catharanthi]